MPTSTIAASNGDSFWIEFIDVGQGDAALIQCDGHYMLIDGGPSDASSLIYTILKNNSIMTIDCIISTHPDADHVGGLSGALNYATVKKCYSPVISHDTKTFKSFLKYLNKQNVSITIPKAGDGFKLGSADVDIVGPIYNNSSTNSDSIVVKIKYGKNSFLFMGDAETDEEASILAARKDLACDVIKIGHHGSKTSTSNELIKRVNPKYGVISVGKKNSYGHPTAETLSKLIRQDVEIFRTDMQGDILCVSDGKKISFSTEKKVSAEKLRTTGDGEVLDATGKITKQDVAKTKSVPSDTTYILNKKTKRIHIPTCKSVNDMAEKNKEYSTKSLDKLIEEGYKPCGNCHPDVGIF